MISAARSIGALGTPLPRPAEELLLHGVRHTLQRDRQVISHHYDVGNDFYELVLGPAMTYSCARFATATTNLEEAQAAKHELICRKLGLHERRVADGPDCSTSVAAGGRWRSTPPRTTTPTSSGSRSVPSRPTRPPSGRRPRARRSRRHPDPGLSRDRRRTVRRDLLGRDVRTRREQAHDRVLHASVLTARAGRATAQSRHCHDRRFQAGSPQLRRPVRVPRRRTARHRRHRPTHGVAGFEVRDVENLREHYAQTLRHWVANLEHHWDAAVELVGEARARVWLLYMSGSINGFDDGGLQLMQALGVRLADDGASEMPTRTAGADLRAAGVGGWCARPATGSVTISMACCASSRAERSGVQRSAARE